MGADKPQWYQIGINKLRRKDRDGGTNLSQTVDTPRSPEVPKAPRRAARRCDGAMVARSQILVSGSTATLSGTLTNESGCDVHFNGTPPYVVSFDTDGSEPILFGDFNSPPREQPSSGDWVMHPGASVPYRSLPVTMMTPDARWDGTDWCTSSQSTALDTLPVGRARKLPTIQLFN